MKKRFAAVAKYLLVACAFAACGVLSSGYCLENNFPAPLNAGYYLLGFPFALLFTILFMRTEAAVVTAFLMSMTWIVAATLARLGGPWNPLPALIGGLIGGLGVTLSASIGCKRLLSPRYLTAGGIVGCLSALPIGIWMRIVFASDNETPPLALTDYHLYCAFGIWQAAMGTFLYAAWQRVSAEH